MHYTLENENDTIKITFKPPFRCSRETIYNLWAKQVSINFSDVASSPVYDNYICYYTDHHQYQIMAFTSTEEMLARQININEYIKEFMWAKFNYRPRPVPYDFNNIEDIVSALRQLADMAGEIENAPIKKFLSEFNEANPGLLVKTETETKTKTTKKG